MATFGIGASGSLPLNPLVFTGSEESAAAETLTAKLRVESLNFHYGSFQALHSVSIEIPRHGITALIGPSGCGKSTFLRTLNRMSELTPHSRTDGKLWLDGVNLFSIEATQVRRRIGMVFQRPNPFPKSIFDNIAYGIRLGARVSRSDLAGTVESSLRKAALWEEVKDDLHKSAMSLSGGQQQRLCIARAFAVNPEVILFDEPCSALDPISTQRIEEVMLELRNQCTMIVVTHNLQQARRIAERTGFFMLGRLVEYSATETIFQQPTHQETHDYVNGRMG
jgi:phosphate transport system ATP-binding protein